MQQVVGDLGVAREVGWSEGLGHVIEKEDLGKAFVESQGRYMKDLDT